jgi:hypothetical protein
VNLLPWLLDWPPSRGTVAVFLLLTTFSAGTLVLFGGVTEPAGGNVTVETSDVSVRLNDQQSTIPDVENGTVHTCLGSGTPPDSILVVGDVTVDVPPELVREHGELSLAVSLAHTDQTTTETVTEAGQTTESLFWRLSDDETLSVDETARLQVRVRAGGEVLAEMARPTTVEEGSRSYDCDSNRLTGPTADDVHGGLPGPSAVAER